MVDPFQKTIQTFNDTVEEYKKLTDDLLPKELLDKFCKILKPGSTVLDLGCGPGRDAEEFTKRGFKVVGIDAAEKMIAAAKERSPESDFQVMDMRSLDFENESFDGVWACASIFFVPKSETPGVLSEIYRVLKPDGVLYAGLKEGDTEGLEPDQRYDGKEKYYAYFSEDEAVRLFEKAGFKEIEYTLNDLKNNYNRKFFINIFCKK